MFHLPWTASTSTLSHYWSTLYFINLSITLRNYSAVTINRPRQANLVLIAYASSEGSGEPTHRAVSPEPSLLAHTSSESRGTFRQKARSLATLNGCACAVKIFHDGMLDDTNSLDGAQIINCSTEYKTSQITISSDLHNLVGHKNIGNDFVSNVGFKSQP